MSSVCCLWGLFTLFPSSLGIVSLSESSLCVGLSLTAPGFNHLCISTVQSTQKSEAASSLTPQNELECCLCCRHLVFQALVAYGTTNRFLNYGWKCQEEGGWWESIIALDLGAVTKCYAGEKTLSVAWPAIWVGWASVSPSTKWVLSIPCSLEQWYPAPGRQWNTWMQDSESWGDRGVPPSSRLPQTE